MAIQFLEIDFPTKIHLGDKNTELSYTVVVKLARKLPQTLFLKVDLRTTYFGEWGLVPCIGGFGTW